MERQLGEFVGHVKLSITNKALSGSVEGDYIVNGQRIPVAGGRLDLTSTPKACVTIRGGLGEFCAQF